MSLITSPVIRAEGEDEGSQYVYTINGYNSSSIIHDAEGNTIRGYAYCLDHSLHSPSGNAYMRVPLSQVTDLSDWSKVMLAKIIVNRTALQRYVRNTYKPQDRLLEQWSWISENLDTLNTSISSEDSYNSRVRSLSDSSTIIQRMIWSVVYDDFDAYVHMNGQNGTLSESYCQLESRFYYVSTDPINDPHSLWNVMFKPLIDYIDSTYPNPFDSGIDIWVYLSEDREYQDMIGTVISFTEVNIAKRDEEGNYLPGATLQVIDSEGNVIDEWVTDDTNHYISMLYPRAEYTLHEVTPPQNYDPAPDITFTVNENGSVTSSVTGLVENDILIMTDTLTVIEEDNTQTDESDETDETEATEETTTATETTAAETSTAVEASENNAVVAEASVETTAETSAETIVETTVASEDLQVDDSDALNASRSERSDLPDTGEAVISPELQIAAIMFAAGIVLLIIRRKLLKDS
ncbi:MAG: hypothetical protein IJ757_08500 [Clostridiales bacterium]|nr:hypothetical protein [Clostridiales bacterium]